MKFNGEGSFEWQPVRVFSLAKLVHDRLTSEIIAKAKKSRAAREGERERERGRTIIIRASRPAMKVHGPVARSLDGNTARRKLPEGTAAAATVVKRG